MAMNKVNHLQRSAKLRKHEKQLVDESQIKQERKTVLDETDTE